MTIIEMYRSMYRPSFIEKRKEKYPELRELEHTLEKFERREDINNYNKENDYFLILFIIKENGEITHKQITKRVYGEEKSNCVVRLMKLKAYGLITHTNTRKKRYYLTERGNEFVNFLLKVQE